MKCAYTCDLCGAALRDPASRFVVRLELKQAYDPMEIGPKDLERDLKRELAALVRAMEAQPEADAERLAEEVGVSRTFILCAPCAASVTKRLGNRPPPSRNE
ncbi:MAG: hypothetical protein HS116_07935 [Planctomycetes bacterium]|nr:hypothetical protein [Planctomycetota bacterium]